MPLASLAASLSSLLRPLLTMPDKRKDEPQRGVALKTRDERKTKRPRMYRVLLHNDDYTPMDFVVRLLQTVFHHSESRATEIMLRIHNTGVGVAGVFTHEIAETKVAQVHMIARQNECPLMASMDPEDDPDAEP
jgi:ATP-dependent Clp protease adaptor protein ClpS